MTKRIQDERLSDKAGFQNKRRKKCSGHVLNYQSRGYGQKFGKNVEAVPQNMNKRSKQYFFVDFFSFFIMIEVGQGNEYFIVHIKTS